jgi:hypothetical protein
VQRPPYRLEHAEQREITIGQLLTGHMLLRFKHMIAETLECLSHGPEILVIDDYVLLHGNSKTQLKMQIAHASTRYLDLQDERCGFYQRRRNGKN